MPKKLSLVAASIVVFAFVFISIAHACSGLTTLDSPMQQNKMSMGADGDPCGTKKPDVCKSVRDSLLSVKPTDAAADSRVLSPSTLSFLTPVNFSPLGLVNGITSPLALKPPSRFSPVLRI